MNTDIQLQLEYGSISDRTVDQMIRKVISPIGEHGRIQVDTQVWDRVNDQVWERVREPIRGQVRGQVRDQLNTNI